MEIERNVGGADMVVRILLGIALVLIAMFADISTLWRTVAWIGAAVALVTAVVGFCPVNKLLGVNTSNRL